MRILITRPRKDAAALASALEAFGAEAVFLPTIEITPVSDTACLDRALTNLGCYDWLVLTSANAVVILLERVSALGIERLPGDLHVAAVGPKTAERLKAGGISPHFIPQEYIAEAILLGLGDLRGRWVLLPTADIAPPALPDAIQEADGFAHVITAYHTIPAQPDPDGLSALRAGVDMITFMSGSAARNFKTLVERAGLDPFNLPEGPRIACIGPKTANAAQDEGFHIDIIAQTYTVEGLAQAIAEQMKEAN